MVPGGTEKNNKFSDSMSDKNHLSAENAQADKTIGENMSNTADQLIAGYTAYTDAEEIGASSVAEAPATTPSILSFIGVSSIACGATIGSIITGTVKIGC
jgi:hypothetical protein